MLGTGPLDDAPAATLRLAEVGRALHDEHGRGDAAQQSLGLVDAVGEPGSRRLGQDDRARGLAGEADDVLELLGRVRLGSIWSKKNSA